jgi:hypothetical protein
LLEENAKLKDLTSIEIKSKGRRSPVKNGKKPQQRRQLSTQRKKNVKEEAALYKFKKQHGININNKTQSKCQ